MLKIVKKYINNFKLLSYLDLLNTYFPVFCSPLNVIDNGNVTYDTPFQEEGYIVDTVAELNCDPGYKPSASSAESRQCEQLGDWTGQTQACIEGT